jgi:hypothetical protein
MANDKFSIKEALKYGWDTFKANIPFFIGFMVVIGLITIVPDYIAEKVLEPKSVGLLVTKIVLRVIGLILGMVSTRIALDLHDSGQPDLSRLGEIIPQIPSYIVLKIVYGLVVFVGLILLVIPGIIFAYMFLYVGIMLIDKNIGLLEGWNPFRWITIIIDAFGESRILTDGYKMDLFLFTLAVMLVNIAGIVCLFVGIFVTIPVTLMASIYVYRRLFPAESAGDATIETA